MSRRRWFASHGYTLCLSLYIAFVMYGSLAPFGFVTPAVSATSIIRSAWARPFSDISLTDFAANILLFVPCGFLAMGVVAGQSIPRRWTSSGVAITAAAIGLSASIEWMQLYLPARTFAVSDVVAETFGAIAGIALWIVYRAEVEELLQGVFTSAMRRPALFGLSVAYIACFVAAHLYPLDLTADIGELGRKYREGRIVFAPFSAPISAGEIVKSVAAAFPIGIAAAMMAGNTLPVSAVWLITVGVLAAVEFAQLLIRSQASEVTHVLVGSAGALLGVFTARVLFPNGQAQTHRSGIPAPASRMLLAILWTAIVIAVQWWPLQFEGDPEYLRERVTAMTATSYGLAAISWNVFLGLSLGFVLARAWPSRRDYGLPRIRIAVLALVACSTLAAIEFGQLFIPVRHPHPSNGVAGAIGAMLGLHVERIATRSSD